MVYCIQFRWLEYQPPGVCHTGIEELIGLGVAGATGAAEVGAATGLAASLPSLSTIGTVASIAGTGLSVIGELSKADHDEAIARNEALALKQKANEDAALGQRAAITEDRKTQLLQSRVRALAGASGTDPASPSTVNIEGEIAQQGGYNAFAALHEGMARSRGDTAQADIDLFKARRAADAGPLNALGAAFSGISSLASTSRARRSGLLKLFAD